MTPLSQDCGPFSHDWWIKLEEGDPDGWTELLRLLLPLAMQALREKFGLIQLHGGNEASAEAALYSAWSSFQRHYCEQEFENIRDFPTLAGHFIRIAYNRWQRDRNAQRKMDRAVAEGVMTDGSGQPVSREYKDSSPCPVERLVADEFAEYLWAAVDLVKGELSDRALRAVQGYLDDLARDMQRTQADLARSMGMSQAAVSRHLNAFRDRLRAVLVESGRL